MTDYKTLYENSLIEIQELKEHLKKYTAPKRNKTFYENHKEDIIKKVKEYRKNHSVKKPSPEKCENIYLPDKKGVQRKIHSVLTFQMENKRMGCINRDMNAVNNMVKIVKTYLTDKTRPEKFRRDYKFPEEIKDDNPIISNNNRVKYHHA